MGIRKSYPLLLIILMSVCQKAAIHFEPRLRSHVDAWFCKPNHIEEIRETVVNPLGSKDENTEKGGSSF